MFLWLIKFFPFLGVLPAIIETALAAIKPILVAISEALVWYLKKIWEGFLDVVDNFATILFVASCLFALFVGVRLDEGNKCEAEKAAIKRQISKPKAKVTYGPKNFFEEIFGGKW